MTKKNANNIVISPSGNLYGSENVLCDFLNGSHHNYDIYIPKDSVLYYKLKTEGFNVFGFTNLKLLYILVFFKMLFSSENLYLNEAGHISYVKIISKLLTSKKFVVSVRLLEDCNNKLKNLSENITLVPVSNYLKTNIFSNAFTTVIYDPYCLTNLETPTITNNQKLITIGLVGRVSFTKGLDDLIVILNQLSIFERQKIQLQFYGTFDDKNDWFKSFKDRLDYIDDINYKLCGFKEQSEIYPNCNLILHLNKVEALGRIIFEAVDFDVPFLCYKQGGTGELANFLKLSNLTCSDINEFVEKIKLFIIEKGIDNHDFKNAKAIINSQFNPIQYAEQIETYLI